METKSENRSPDHPENVSPFSEPHKQKPAFLPDDLLTDGELTTYLKLSQGTLAIWRHECRGPPYIKID